MRRLLLGLLLIACGDPAPGTTVRLDYADVAEDFWAAPFPSDARRVDGRPDASGFPNVPRAPIIDTLKGILESADGFATTSTIYFTTTAPLAPIELEPDDTVSFDAPVLLVPLSGDVSPHPIEVRFLEEGGPFGAANMLSLLPLQGRPLRFGTKYAAVVRTTVMDAEGEPLDVADVVRTLRRGRDPEGMDTEAASSHREALEVLEAQGVDDVAALSVFETWDPTTEMTALHQAALAEPLPTPESPLTLIESYDDFCVFESTLQMPIYQAGEPPFSSEGGEIEFVDGVPQRVGSETARIFVTLPRSEMPSSGFPAVLFSRTGGGGDRPLIDRGVRDASGEPIEAGSGPARDFAQVGWAGVQIDGPHGGIRNVSMADEQILIFNVGNPRALKDNIRQSAVELALGAHIIEALRFDGSACAETAAAEIRFDTTHLTLMGHSMGATISPLTFAVEPRFRALLLSGAGGSWIENVVHKELPVRVKPIAEVTLRVAGRWELHEHDPALMLLQWAGEPADPPVYREPVRSDERHILMMQGIVDRYILPPIANTTSLAFDLDLAGDPYDTGDDPDLEGHVPLETRLSHSNGSRIGLPAAGNQGGATAIVTQYPEDGVEDGHEVVFQRSEPKAQYRCFLQTLAGGTAPTVPAPGGACE